MGEQKLVFVTDLTDTQVSSEKKRSRHATPNMAVIRRHERSTTTVAPLTSVGRRDDALPN